MKLSERLRILRTDITSPVGAEQWHVQDTATGRYYIASGVDAMLTGWECLVFAADANGKVTDFRDVAGGQGMTHDEALADLLMTLLEEEADEETG